MDWVFTAQGWIAFGTLASLELVLGIDNIVFISILTDKLPASQRPRARTVGLALAMLMRVALLFSLSWLMRLTEPLLHVAGKGLSGRDLILLLGGLFLIGKSTYEIHDKLEGEEGRKSSKVAPSFSAVMVQIVLLDVVFSLDSVITAVGMVDRISIMVAAVVAAVLFMMAFAGAVSEFLEERPTVKMLALSFLLLVGFTLFVEGLGHHVPKGYVYFAMAFSIFTEMLNLRMRRKAPVHLHQRYAE